MHITWTNLKMLCCMKEEGDTSISTLWFYVYDIHEEAKLMCSKNKNEN